MIRRLKLALWVLAGLILAALSAVLVMDNGATVRLRLLAYETPPAPVFVWLFVALGGGIVTGFALASVSLMKGRAVQRRLRKDRDRSERELGKLRGARETE